jgi:hypothetical protein
VRWLLRSLRGLLLTASVWLAVSALPSGGYATDEGLTTEGLHQNNQVRSTDPPSGWVKIRRRVRVRHHPKLSRPPHYAQWLCIHRFEGSWSDSGDPYWGGLQMDRGFMRTYGSDMIRKYGGFAHRWPPLVQMWVAERAAFMYYHGHKPRGFYPWPNTARYCGLI